MESSIYLLKASDLSKVFSRFLPNSCLTLLCPLVINMHHCTQNTWPLVQITNNHYGHHWKSGGAHMVKGPEDEGTVTCHFDWLCAQPTSSSLSLSDPALHRDWLDDSLLAELWKTEHTQYTWLINHMLHRSFWVELEIRHRRYLHDITIWWPLLRSVDNLK